jgi:aryl-alcohol dehydrogenase-like predicted oxidoreductase
VKAGKARYIGASSMYAWQFAKAQHVAERHGWTKFVTMQNHYNVIYREEEREMLPLCVDQGVGVIPWSPLARGFITRDPDQATSRSETDEFGKTLYGTANLEIVREVAAIAAERGVSRAAIGLAWVAKHPAVSAPIVGATKQSHIDDALASLDITLTADEIQRLESPYTPQPIQGH